MSGWKQQSRKILTLVTGNVVAQSVAILVIPLITRAYSPIDFGTLALFTAMRSEPNLI